MRDVYETHMGRIIVPVMHALTNLLKAVQSF